MGAGGPRATRGFAVNTVTHPAPAVEKTAERPVHALYSHWTTPECGADDYWYTPFWTGNVTCPDCLAALPIGAAGVASGGAR